MGVSVKRYLLAASASLGVLASPAAAPNPVITPAALLPRADYRTLGWYSDATTDGQTIYAPWEYDIEATTYSSSGSFFRRCPVTTSCIMYTACSNGFLVGASTSSYCGAGGASGSLFCSNHVLLPTLGASSSALSWFWCDEAPLTGYTFFATEPAQPSQLSSGSISGPASSGATTTASDGSSASTATTSTSSESATNTSGSGSGGSKTNVGAIAGGVVGGVAALAAFGVALFFILTRRKRKAANAQPPTGYQPPPATGPMSPHPPSAYPQGPNTEYSSAYQANEAKPQGIQELGGYYHQPYPQGPYDPHMSQHYPSSPPPLQQTSPQPQYAAPQSLPQELPATQK